MSKFKLWIKSEREKTGILLRSIPATVVTLFVVSVICMNLLANKTLLQLDWIALDGGILISWLSFMCMDIITKHFGPGASNRISVLAALINLLTCLIFFTASVIPSNANDYTEFDRIFGGTWFILLGSTVAFISSAVINNMLNFAIGGVFKKYPDGKTAYAMRSYVSTFIGQFLDNFIFSVIVFVGFAPVFWNGFSWSVLQCMFCALTGAVAELIMEIVFSPIGYRITKKWQEHDIGREYFNYESGKEKLKKMKVLVTGSSQGIGKAIAELFLKRGHKVVGIDRQPASIENGGYTHVTADIRDRDALPEISDIDILINNAGTQNEDDIEINLKSLIYITERYGVHQGIKAILNIGSASGHTGAEFPEYCASKGGVIAYTKNTALRVAKFGATCNSLDPGGVITPLNECVINDGALWEEIMKETPLKRWASVDEIAEWAYFLTVENKFCTGQSIVVDGGESINFNFVWKD